MLNKKGISTFAIAMWILRFLFLGIVSFIIILLVGFFAKIDIDTFNVEPDIIVYNMMYSPHGLSYYDAVSNRVYPGIIDIEGTAIDKINYSQHIGAMVVVRDLDGSVLFEKTINPKTYRRRVEALPGPGGFDSKKKELNILVKKDEKLIPAKMEVEVVVQRTI